MVLSDEWIDNARTGIVKFRMKHGLINYWEIDKFIAPEHYRKAQLLEPHYSKKICYAHRGNALIRAALRKRVPLMVSRFGGTELDCIEHFIKYRTTDDTTDYTEQIKTRISRNAGVFPVADAFLDKFSEFFLEHITCADIMGVVFNDYEPHICNTYCPHAELVELGCIEPYHWRRPWSGELRGKKVLVVHPFAESIKKQYAENRRFLFKNRGILPEFELKTVQAVQSSANAMVNFTSWFDAYRYMCDEILKIDFDVSITGAGAYGLPLASFVKQLGKQGINIGGFTQVLFGIKGRRFEMEYADTTAKLFNDYWIRPSRDETPEQYEAVENGCYW